MIQNKAIDEGFDNANALPMAGGTEIVVSGAEAGHIWSR